MQSSKIDRIKDLVEQLNAASESYYAKDQEIMSNYEYDKLYDELVELEKETGVTLANSPTVNVGYEAVDELPKERLYGNILITTHGAALAGILNNIRKEPLEKYWGIGVHNNCAVTEVEVKNAEAKILSENVTYYKETVRPWAGN